MPRLSNKSGQRLNECHPLLQRLMIEAIEKTDFSVLCGYRGKEEQEAAYAAGHSKLRWPRSMHNKVPSLAVDIVPYPIDWDDIARFHDLALTVKQCWEELTPAERGDWDLSWGGDWDTFKDLPHWQIQKK